MYENEARIMGNVGKVKDGNGYRYLSVITKRPYKKDGKWESKDVWHNIMIRGKKAEYKSVQNIQKGDFVYIVGEIDVNDKGVAFIGAAKVQTIPKGEMKKGKTEEQSQVNNQSKDDELPF